MSAEAPTEMFTAATVLVAEGARVALVTCKRCGATVLLDPRDDEDRPGRHREWHGRIEGLGDTEALAEFHAEARELRRRNRSGGAS